MTRSLFAALAVLLASPAYGQTSGCGVGCADVTVPQWAYQNDPERVREQRERDQTTKRTRVFVCKLHTYRVRAYYCWEQSPP